MIDASLFKVAKLEEAPAMSVFLVDDHRVVLVIGEERVALFPSGLRNPWQFFQPEDNGRWTGVVFPDVRIRIDVASMVTATRADLAAGMVSYRDDDLIIRSNGEADRGYAQPWVSLSKQILEPSHRLPQIAFTKWEVFVQDGEENIVLLTIDAGNVVGGLLYRPD